MNMSGRNNNLFPISGDVAMRDHIAVLDPIAMREHIAVATPLFMHS
jgi:hypothetical protein